MPKRIVLLGFRFDSELWAHMHPENVPIGTIFVSIFPTYKFFQTLTPKARIICLGCGKRRDGMGIMYGFSEGKIVYQTFHMTSSLYNNFLHFFRIEA